MSFAKGIFNYFKTRTHFRKLKRFTLPRIVILCIIGGSSLAYQIYEIDKRFSHLLSRTAMEKEAQKLNYIYVSCSDINTDNIFHVSDTFYKWENMVKIMIQGPKSLGNDPNPWHLIRILKSEKFSSEHGTALYNLATSKFSEGLCKEIAQSCDLNIAVKMARVPGVNLNLFLPPPSVQSEREEDTSKLLYEMLMKMLSENDDVCVRHLIERAQHFVNNDKHKILIHDQHHHTIKRNPSGRQAKIIQLYLEALLQQSESLERSLYLIQNGILAILWQISHSYEDNLLLATTVLQIIANFAKYKELHVHIFQSGWVGLLAKYLNSSHLSLKLPAGKALANMDNSFNSKGIYTSPVYLLHPLQNNEFDRENFRQENAPQVLHESNPWDMDVIFVHGLLGGIFWTWRQSDSVKDIESNKYTYCWPCNWLPEDVPGLRILGIDYETQLSLWKSKCPTDHYRRTIKGRSDELLASLHLAGIGRRPIVWVAHSMGGLLVKQMLITAFRSENKEIRNIATESQAIMMLSVPHGGSSLASLNTTARILLLPSIEVQELRPGSTELQQLNQEFLQLLAQHSMTILNFLETKPTPIRPLGMEVIFVEPHSADMGFGELHYVPANHLDICKPVNRNSLIYQHLLRLIQEVKARTAVDNLDQQ